MNAKSRSAIYAANITIGIVAFACAVLVVLGVITEENILTVAALTLSLSSVFAGTLARLNITPDKE